MSTKRRPTKARDPVDALLSTAEKVTNKGARRAIATRATARVEAIVAAREEGAERARISRAASRPPQPTSSQADKRIDQLVRLVRDMEQYAYEHGLSFGEPLKKRIGQALADDGPRATRGGRAVVG